MPCPEVISHCEVHQAMLILVRCPGIYTVNHMVCDINCRSQGSNIIALRINAKFRNRYLFTVIACSLHHSILMRRYIVCLLLCSYQRIFILSCTRKTAIWMDNHAVIFIVVSLLIHFCYKTLLIPVYNAGINLDVHSNLICHRFHSVIVIHKSRLLRLVCTCNLCPRCRDISVRAITTCNLSRFVIKGTHIFRPLPFQGIYDSPCRPRHRYRSAVLHNRNPVHIAFLIWISVTV